MVLILLLIGLAALATYTWMQPTSLDVLKVEAFRFSIGPTPTIVRVSDMLTGIGILGVVALTRGPLMVASAAMFVLWALALVGFTRFAGLDVRPLIVYVVIVGGVVQVVTWKGH